jgi:tRNA pseudouridine38-40 synthase
LSVEGESARRHFRALLEYRGADFAGWQLQPNQRTVQGELERALETLCREPVRVYGSGRTDSGVHARGQVATFRSRTELGTERLLRGINGLTGDDMSAWALDEAPEDFHPQYSARGKVYVYRLLLRRSASPLLAASTWHVPYGDLDVERLQAELKSILGEADWGGYRASDCGASTTVKTLRRAEVRPEAHGVLALEFEGSGFLKQMVRILVGTAVDVGRGRLEEGAMLRIRAAGDRTLAGRTAPAHGLCLEQVIYPPSGSSD